MRYTETLHNPVYLALGVPADLEPYGGSSLVSVTVIDKTAGVEIADSSSIDVGTIRPVAAVRAAELVEKGVALDSLDDGFIAFNGKVWRIKSHIPRPSPHGEADGQVYLILMEHQTT